MVIVVQKTDIEFALTIVAIPVTIVVLLLAGYFTRKESKLGMAGIIVSPAHKNAQEKAGSLKIPGPLLRRPRLLLL